MSAIVTAEGHLNNVKTTCSSLGTSSKGETRHISKGYQPPSMWRTRVKGNYYKRRGDLIEQGLELGKREKTLKLVNF